MQSNPIEQAALADVPASQDGKGFALHVRQLVKRYGGREVLHGIDLQAAPGEFLAIVGRSGCGKSTLLRLVAGLEDSDGGGVTLDGAPGHKQREAVRVMFQDARLLPWKTVLDNVALGLPRARRADAARVLGQVGLAERAGEWPARLSGGQRQRVALARALVHHPRLLLLDEPLGALDALTRIEMQGLIEALWQRLGFTALLVTHDVSEAVALADRVVLIEDGRIALDQRVTLPRPRQRGSAALAQLEDAVLRRVMQRDGATPADDSVHGQALAPAVDWSVARTVDSVRWAI
ncbi:ABC transporter [Cupriavidus basilensis OR16]|uniref:ABC transporter n=1 Tax=Cupriavidus basilensis OR16 TaxID=1127483 RepID=H1SCD1_9BURK|nr:ATP-binding cassette domain-containing protein [Cupriavidus basilensis]EHP39756.1 ABC transporter [Cupriavidus basilensis OR16]